MFTVKVRHVKLVLGCAATSAPRDNDCTELRVVYRSVYVDWKLRKTDEKHAGRFTLLYELDLKATNVGQTDRQTDTHTHMHTHTHTHKVSTVTLVSMWAPSVNN